MNFFFIDLRIIENNKKGEKKKTFNRKCRPL
jgi:hypothetical protein